MARIVATIMLLVLLAALAQAALPLRWRGTVDGEERTAVVYVGTKALEEASPLVLAFHGLGGTDWYMSRVTKLHEAWPEATVVYPQALKILLANPERWETGWQRTPGADNDRDLHFIDFLLDDLCTRYRVDNRRIYATGVSNGALFTYELLVTRPERFAAFAPVAGAAPVVRFATTPRPVLIIQGKKDTRVKPAWAEATRDLLRQLNGCGAEEREWAPGYTSYHPCQSGQPIIWRLNDGGHVWPAEATSNIVRFFQEY